MEVPLVIVYIKQYVRLNEVRFVYACSCDLINCSVIDDSGRCDSQFIVRIQLIVREIEII